MDILRKENNLLLFRINENQTDFTNTEEVFIKKDCSIAENTCDFNAEHSKRY